MDTSETYIKMCDCEEMQKAWKPSEWDWIYVIPEEDWEVKYIWNILPFEIADHGVYGPYIEENGCLCDRGDKYIWLPRQDQIQEMLEFSAMRYGMFKVFCDWLDKNRLYIGLKELITPEQLWLAFYMHEKHSMIWDGEKWVLANGG